MRKIFLLTIMVFVFSGCSLIKTAVAPLTPVKNTLPQQTEKTARKEVCKGKAVYDANGNILSCSKGYYLKESTYNKAERKLTAKEKFLQFLNRFIGLAFWGVVACALLFPALLGVFAGRLLEGIIGIGSHSLKGVARAVQKFRKNGGDLNQHLDAELDEKDKKYIRKLKDKEKI